MHIPLTTFFESMIFFSLRAAAIWIAGACLAHRADALVDRFKLSQSLVGLLPVPLATSRPEVAISLAAAVDQARDLVQGIALHAGVRALSDFYVQTSDTSLVWQSFRACVGILVFGLSLFSAQRMAIGSRCGVFGCYSAAWRTVFT